MAMLPETFLSVVVYSDHKVHRVHNELQDHSELLVLCDHKVYNELQDIQ